MIKIAIAGTHGVGKTTLAQDLVETLAPLKVSLNSKIARSLIQKGVPLGKNATTEAYIQYIIAQLSAEQNVEACDIFISDRTLLDPLTYAMVNRDYVEKELPESTIEMLKLIWALERQQYNLYVFVPIEFPMERDGIRPQDDVYRNKVEAQMKTLLDESQINYIIVSGSVSERNAQVTDAVRKLITNTPCT